MEIIVDTACEKLWQNYSDDCSGFVKAVALEVGICLTGNANNIIERIGTGIIPWRVLKNGAEAAQKASEDNLVIAGIKKHMHGHLVIVLPGDLAYSKYPLASWGTLSGVGEKRKTLNYAFRLSDRDKLVYAYHILGR